LGVCLFVYGTTAPLGQSLLIHEVSRSHTMTHHSQWDTSGRMISSSQRPPPDNTHNTTDVRPCPRWDSNPQSQSRAPVDLSLRARGQWDRRWEFTQAKFSSFQVVGAEWFLGRFSPWKNETTTSSRKVGNWFLSDAVSHPRKTGSSQTGLAYKIIKPGMVSDIYTKWHAILYQVRLTVIVQLRLKFIS
jgi:hypothetical protein